MDFGDSEGHGAARDLLIAGFGNWPAGSAHWTVRKYFEKVKSFAEAYTIGGKRCLVWLGIVPIPFVSYEWSERNNDWRTMGRMRLLDIVARNATQHLVQQGLVSFVDIFPLAMAAIRWSADNAHLKGVDPALDGVIRLLLPHIYLEA